MTRLNEFKAYHPIVNFTYFLFVILFSCVFMHPVCLLISLLSAFIYSIMLKGKKTVRTNLLYMLPMLIGMALLNAVFNHEGVTILAYMPSGNPLTGESLIYGFAAAAMIASVICHFLCYSEVMTSDKFIYLFGRIIPSLSLILSMVLRFVPRFMHQIKVVADAQKTIGRDVWSGSIVKRAKCGLSIISIMVTWSLENAIDTADSMKSRGYGEKGRGAFSNFVFDSRDKKTFFIIVILGIYVLAGAILGAMDFIYFPSVKGNKISVFSASVFWAYLMLCIVPIVIEIWEVRRWKAIESRI